MSVIETSTLSSDCDEMMEKLVDYEVSPNEAQERATKFLSLAYRINHRVLEVKNNIIKAKVLADASYAAAFKGVDEKANVSKAKALASADKGYLKQSVELQKLEAEESYWKSMYEIMNNGHIFYKLLTRE